MNSLSPEPVRSSRPVGPVGLVRPVGLVNRLARRPLVASFVAPLCFLIFCATAARGAKRTPLAPDRIDAIARMVPERTEGPGPPISDRAAWDEMRRNPAYAAMIGSAQALLTVPLPAQPDELYLEFSRNGNRTNFQSVASDRRKRLTPLVIAECLENKGRFLPAIEDLITTLCAERTWVLPAHDKPLDNFRGGKITIDLASSALTWHLAVADHLLGERLSAATRDLLRRNTERRALAPFRAMIRGERPLDRWLTQTNNWNPVCLAGVVGAALIHLPSARERAEFIAAAETYTPYFLSGFTADGYCSEGLAYWNYGYGHYALLSELIRSATRGRIELLADPRARAPALFASRIAIMNGVSPAFADCGVTAGPYPAVMALLKRRIDMKGAGAGEIPWSSTLTSLGEAMTYRAAFRAQPSPLLPPAGAARADGDSVRSWFEDAVVLVCRPAAGSPCRIGAAFKGGNNAEHHNHNDLGSYVVVQGGRPVLLDPGGEVYTARTFSAKRYESKLLNSYGHPVPVVGGRLQEKGASARGETLESVFTDAADTLRLNLASAYKCPELKRLERTFVYSREGAGSLTVTDLVEFTAPQSFETALITAGTYLRKDERTLLIEEGQERLEVKIDTGGAPFELIPDVIKENAPVQPTRLGIRLVGPVTSARITVTVRSAAR